MIFQATIGERTIRLNITRKGGQPFVALEDDTPNLDLVQISPFSYSLLVDHHSHHLSIRSSREGYMVDLRRRTYFVRLRDDLDLTIEKLGLNETGQDHSGQVLAPIPGLITGVSVVKEDEVASGDKLLILEAMKMENEITAPMDGIISAVYVSPGEIVEKGALLIEIHRH
ncbi:acetyl-CoA carboxylase biotin carboxyl carrier protein subunit [Candidatus Neomarinimicrobiota bacterium]